MRTRIAFAVSVGAVLAFTACAADKPPAQHAAPIEEAEAPLPLPPSELETRLPASVRDAVLRPFTGDVDSLVKRRVVRIGVAFNRTFYFVDKGVPRGIAYEYGQLMEARLNKHFRTDNSNKIHVIFLPLPREMLLPALVDGKVDLVAAQLPATPELQQHVAFSDPTRTNVRQILVTAPDGPPIRSIEDLAGKEVFAREFGGYSQGLVTLNEYFTGHGMPPVVIREAPPNLEDDDLLEMVNAGLIPAVVVDDYLAAFWKKVFRRLVVHDSIQLHSGGTLALAVRKTNPHLLAALNTFMGKYGLGTAFGNRVNRDYLVNATYAKSATSVQERKSFMAVVALFRKYGTRYKIDFLLMAAQGYQESRLHQWARSPVGAIGIMQIMPETGKLLKVGDITQLEPNIHAGVKFMSDLRNRNFANEPMDDLNKGLFSFAAYNAGPNRVRQLRLEAEQRGLNPNVWFGNVEQIASERIGRETVTYVANIFKYYVAYRLVLEETERRNAAKAAVKAEN
ncbi:MAG TPA: transporter substrate-binding domain-containing protein [Gemmatimonadales bacterium]|nr:transporter substrate-binding domain-containing protein [Gemmatimonadales bacterium]